MKNSEEHCEKQQILLNLSELILNLLSNNTYKHGLFMVLLIILIVII